MIEILNMPITNKFDQNGSKKSNSSKNYKKVIGEN